MFEVLGYPISGPMDVDQKGTPGDPGPKRESGVHCKETMLSLEA